MTYEEVYKDIEKIVKIKLNMEGNIKIESETNFLHGEINLDSIMLLELIVELEELYSIELDDDELTTDKYERAELLAELIISKLA